MAMFKTHPAHINEIKGAIQYHRGAVYFHGSGDIYPVVKQLQPGEMHPSDFRQKHSNPLREDAKYRVKFDNISDVPGTVEEINNLLLLSREQERADREKTVVTGGIDTFRPYGSEEVQQQVSAKDAEIAALKAELEGLKSKKKKTAAEAE